MGTLLFGQDPARLTAALERGRPLPGRRFGAVSCAAPPATLELDPSLGDWLIDHGEQASFVVSRALHRELLMDAAEALGGSFALAAQRKEALLALDRTLLCLAGEGVSVEALRGLATRTTEVDGAGMLSRLATLLSALEARCDTAGLTPRGRALRTASTIAHAPIGFLDDYPGRIAATSLMRALRQHPNARLAIHYSPEPKFERGVAQYFLDAAHRENYALDEVEISGSEEDWVIPDEVSEQEGDLARALAAFSCGVDVLCDDPSLFDALAAHHGASAHRAHPQRMTALGRWAQQPLSRRSVTEWLRLQNPKQFVRALVASPNVLLPSELPAELRLLYAQHPQGEVAVAEAAPLLQLHGVPLTTDVIAQAERLQLRWSFQRWLRLATQTTWLHLEVGEGGTPLLASPWQPSGLAPVIRVGRQKPIPPARSVFTQRLARKLAQLGLLSFAPRMPTQEVVSAENAPRVSVTAAPLPPAPEPASLTLETVSVSDLVAYARCAYQFYLRRIAPSSSVQEATLSAADMGNVVHDALETALRPLLGVPLTNDAIDAAANRARLGLRSAVEQQRKGVRLASRDQIQLQLWQQRLAQFVHDDLQRLQRAGGEVWDLERKVALDIDGLKIRGRIDRLDRVGDSVWLRDYKTGRPAALESEEALQLLLYSHAIEAPLQLVAFVGVFDGVHVGLTTGERFSDLEGTLEVRSELTRRAGHLHELVRGIQSGNFAPEPVKGSETCKRCHVRMLCRFDATRLAGEESEASVAE